MLLKSHLTLRSRTSGSRWLITPSWLPGSWRSFVHSSSVYSSHLFLIAVLYWAPLCMKFSLGISDFLEEIHRLSHYIYFLYLLALITEDGFISPCYSLGLCIQCIVFLFPFLFSFFALLSSLWGLVTFPFFIYFSWEWSWSHIPLQCHKPTSIDLQAPCLSETIPWIYLSLPLYNHKDFDFLHRNKENSICYSRNIWNMPVHVSSNIKFCFI